MQKLIVFCALVAICFAHPTVDDQINKKTSFESEFDDAQDDLAVAESAQFGGGYGGYGGGGYGGGGFGGGRGFGGGGYGGGYGGGGYGGGRGFGGGGMFYCLKIKIIKTNHCIKTLLGHHHGHHYG